MILSGLQRAELESSALTEIDVPLLEYARSEVSGECILTYTAHIGGEVLKGSFTLPLGLTDQEEHQMLLGNIKKFYGTDR